MTTDKKPPTKHKPLTAATQIAALKPDSKLYRRPVEAMVGDGLYIEVAKSGSKLWRFRYQLAGKENMLTLGRFPEIGLKDARDRHAEARKLLARGIDPSQAKKDAKKAEESAKANTFEAVARMWYERWLVRKAPEPKTAKDTLYRLENHLLRRVGKLPVAEVGSSDLMKCLEPIERSGRLSIVKATLELANQVIEYSIYLEIRKTANPCPSLKKNLASYEARHRPAFIQPRDVQRLLLAIDRHAMLPGTSPVVSAALKLLPFVFVRPIELASMKWAHVDFERSEWTYFVTKVDTVLLVPLAPQALEILKDIRKLTQDSDWVFPHKSWNGGHMGPQSLNAALQLVGIDTATEHCAHGFRAMARTMLDEQLGYPPEITEHQLSHKVNDPMGYARMKYLPQRREMMTQWAAYLDELKAAKD